MQPEPAARSAQDTLLRACALMFLFRALFRASDETQRAMWEERIIRLIGELVPCAGGSIVVGVTQQEIAPDCVAVPLYMRGEICGLLAVWFPPEEEGHAEGHRDTLNAVGTLASAALDSARDVEVLRTENALLRASIDPGEAGMVGDSPAVQKLFQMIARVAPRESPVLVLGESGTGKELVAQALHRLSPRGSGPFRAINCAALSEALLESELFGYEKGAFTGAAAQKKGKLELAEGGTVLLDEVGELAPSLQAKLLRVLQQREFERVGGTRTLKLDVRVIAATNRELAEEVRRGTFREDLYHRLNVVALRVPALRERVGDILPLARYFLERAATRCCRRVTGFSAEAERRLTEYGWPGNVRELENAIERAVVLGQSEIILPEDLPETILTGGPVLEAPGALATSVSRAKRELVLAAWRESGGNHNETAKKLNIHPNSLRRLVRVLGLKEIL
jgi:transcriptional regulator with GAF, ATPase, and Fis domain